MSVVFEKQFGLTIKQVLLDVNDEELISQLSKWWGLHVSYAPESLQELRYRKCFKLVFHTQVSGDQDLRIGLTCAACNRIL
jgi:hypothetical protein